MLEVRWHGRGGQGVKTASYLLAESFMELGRYIQAFPEYGPERSGAPVTSYTRVDDKPIIIHSPIVSPDVVIVVDASLIPFVNVVNGLKDGGTVIVNSKKRPAEILEELKRYPLKNRIRVVTVDATGIALKTIGRPIPNVPLIGAFVRAVGGLELEAVKEQLRKSFSKKFTEKIVEANIEALQMGYDNSLIEEFDLVKA